jgi:hypothetical protein
MDTLISVIIIIITFSALYFPLKIFYNLLKYKEAPLGLIFTKLAESILAFKIYAIAVLIFAIGRFLDLLNTVLSNSSIDDLATALYLITTIILIYAFYKLFHIMKIDKQTV